MGSAQGLLVRIANVFRDVFAWPTIMCGVDSAGQPQAVQTDSSGVVATSTTISPPAGGFAKETGGNLDAIKTAVQAVVPATLATAVTPSDATVLTSRAVWVGGAGDLVVRLSGATGTTVTFTAVPAGSQLNLSVVRIMAATTATNINVLN